MKTLDTSYLNVERAEKRGIIHRDYISHENRWRYVHKLLREREFKKIREMVDPWFIRWYAGLISTDGSVHIVKKRKGKRTKKRWYGLHLPVYSQEKDWILIIKEKLKEAGFDSLITESPGLINKDGSRNICYSIYPHDTTLLAFGMRFFAKSWMNPRKFDKILEFIKYKIGSESNYAKFFFKYSPILRFAKRGMKILDIGCGDGMLAQVLYANKYKPEKFVGINISKSQLKRFSERKLNFSPDLFGVDIRKEIIPCPSNFFDLVVCFEVLEHFEKEHVEFVLREMKRVLKSDGTLLLSTPNYDKIHKASAHVHEYEEEELESILSKRFKIENKFGTFASQREIFPELSSQEQKLFEQLKKYYDSNVISTIFAPLHPSESRNILWVLKKPGGKE